MAYSYLKVIRIKTPLSMIKRYEHNRRVNQPVNVDPSRSSRNESLIPLPWKDGKELNYWEAWKLRVQDLPYYQNHKIYKNAVLAIEIGCSYTKGAEIDVDVWKTLTIEWLSQRFNVAADGRSNILHAELHADENSGPHIHAIVVPIDQRGHLSLRSFLAYPSDWSDLVTSYAEAVAPVGLQRGVKGDVSKYEDIRKMYQALNEAKADIPKQEPGESPENFLTRAHEYLETKALSQRKETDDYYLTKMRAFTEYSNETKERLVRDRESMLSEVEQMRQNGLNEVEYARQAALEEVGQMKQEILREREALRAQQQELNARNAELQKVLQEQQELRQALQLQLDQAR